ncbi:MAG: TetR family transcriptional regulator [Acidimicrobiales bacterium]
MRGIAEGRGAGGDAGGDVADGKRTGKAAAGNKRAGGKTSGKAVAGKPAGNQRAGGKAAGADVAGGKASGADVAGRRMGDWMGLAGAPTDRRAARSHRSRNLIVDAAIDLIQNGNPAPTSQQIAKHAGLSVRSLFHHFHHVEIVIRNAAAGQFLRHRKLIAFLPPNGPVGVRVQATCRQRRQLYEAIAPMLRMAYAKAGASEGVNAVLVEKRLLLRRQVAVTLGPEISARGTSAQLLLDTLLLASGWQNWDMLRSHSGYSATAAERLMVHSITDLLRAPVAPLSPRSTAVSR